MKVSAGELKIVICFFIFLNIILFFKVIFFNKVFIPPLSIYSLTTPPVDELEQIYPMYSYATTCLQKGLFPLWNNQAACGTPFLALNQHALLSPLNLWYYLFPLSRVFGIAFMLRTFLAGLFIYFFLRYLGLKKYASMFSAIIFMFNGTAIWSTVFPKYASVIWLPLILLFYIKSLESANFCYVILGGITLGVNCLSGNLQRSFYEILVLLIYAGFRFIREKKLEVILKILLLVAIGLLLASVQILPTYEMLKLSTRNFTYDLVRFCSYSYFLEHFTVPPLFIAETDSEGYLGVLPVALIMLMPFIYKKSTHKPHLVFFSFLIIISLLWSRGIFFKWLYAIFPFFKYFQVKAKFLSVIVFAASCLAGLAMNIIQDLPLIDQRINKKIMISLILIAALGLFLITGWLQPNWGNRIYEIRAQVFLVFLILSVISIILLLRKRGSLSKIFALLLVSVDLLLAGLQITADRGFLSPPRDYASYPLPAILKGGKELNRIIRFRTPYLPPNLSTVFGIYDAQVYDSLLLQKYGLFMNLLETNIFPLTSDFSILEISQKESLNSNLLDLLNVKYVISGEPLPADKFTLMAEIPVSLFCDEKMLQRWGQDKPPMWQNKVMFFQRKHYLPRVFLASKARVFNNEGQIEKYLISKEFNPGQEVILPTMPVRRKETPLKEDLTQADILLYEPNQVKIRTVADNSSWLVLSDIYYPGWQAWVDGRRQNIYEANYTFRAVFLEKGKHVVQFIYKPFSFYVGLGFCTLTILWLNIYFYFQLLSRKKTSHETR